MLTGWEHNLSRLQSLSYSYQATNAVRLLTGENDMKFVQRMCFSFLVIATLAGIGISQDTGAKQDMKDAGHETKEAAKDTGKATKKTAKKTGHEVKHTTKKATHKVAEKTDEGAQKVEDKTSPQ